MKHRVPLFMILLISLVPAASGDLASYDGFNKANWGAAPDAVRQAVGATNWQADGNAAREFPQGLTITSYKSAGDIAGYKAVTTYYFWDNRFFQATVKFNFDDLIKYDFNYNVFRSVNQYYNAIRSKTLVFASEIFDLLRKKYGLQKPVFKDLDPRNSFVELDKYLKRESWNLRYHPYDYYLRIVTQSYARWTFPKTAAIFSIAISAPDKRFDYTLSLSSLDLASRVNAAKDSLRMKGL
jgi:hypothetical protein